MAFLSSARKLVAGMRMGTANIGRAAMPPFSPNPAAAAGIRAFGAQRVRQLRRTRGRIIQLKQTHYEPKPEGYSPLPLSLLGSGPIRRVLKAGTVEAKRLAGSVDWDRYKCDVRGVRWHPVGGWRVQFDRRNYEHNFFVKCSCYFRVAIYGFDRAKELAVGYRRRLDAEWEEQMRIWADLDVRRETARLEKRQQRELAFRAAHQPDLGLAALPPAHGAWAEPDSPALPLSGGAWGGPQGAAPAWTIDGLPPGPSKAAGL